MVSGFLHHEKGKFVAKEKGESSLGYCYYQTLKKKDFYLNSKDIKLAEPILYQKNHQIASALMMPSVIDELTLGLMGLMMNSEG